MPTAEALDAPVQPRFRTAFGEAIFNQKYRHEGAETWDQLAETVVLDVCKKYMSIGDMGQLIDYITDMKFIPGGRYLYYAGRARRFYNNCYIFISQDDTREDWADTSWKHEAALMTGGGTGNDFTIYREENAPLGGTGGVASGPISKMKMINEIGRFVQQGGSRRSALYGSLSWRHPDAGKLIRAKDWKAINLPGTTLSFADAKEADFNFPCPLDMMNISLNYDNAWRDMDNRANDPIFLDNVRMALINGEPGFSFNFDEKENETGRNACTEVTSADDCDVCNLGSINLSRINNKRELADVIRLATMFLLCGTLEADMPFQRIADTRAKNRRLGLGLMGVHEWLIQRGMRYEVTPELHDWLAIYRDVSDEVSRDFADWLGVSRPVANRAIAPTGTLGIVAGTTTGIEPLFAVAYLRRYLKGNTNWVYQYVVDGTAKILIEQYGADPEEIESAIDLASDPERRIKFQADVQDYVDMAISSTINLPEWGSELNNEDKVQDFANILSKYAPRLRGFTVYPDGSRGGQPLTSVPYREAVAHDGIEFTMDVCDLTKGGTCGS
jgi:ribonucleoside-diphosphate reductase alpha chain